MAMMTYKTFCESNENPILNQSDETVQSAVYDWFKYRFIGFSDASKFLDILQRNVKINYPMYQQKLRIEPGVSQYDWLVSTYRERQLKSKGTAGNLRTHGDDTLQHGHTITVTPTGTETVTQSGNETHTRTGGHLETDVEGKHITEKVEGTRTTTNAPKVQRVTSTTGGEQAWSGDTQVQANLPMSKSYTGTISPGTETDKKYYFEKAYDGMPTIGDGSDNLNWETVSAQAQSGHREYHDNDGVTTEKYVYEDGVTGDITITKGDSTAPDEDTRYGDSAIPDTHKVEYNGTLADGSTGERETIEYGDRKAVTSFTDRKTETKNDGIDTSTYGNIEDNGTHENTDREQVTGRNEDPATLLARATTFIEQSSAFMWFREQLDYCFFPGFYTEEDFDETTEGSANI